MPTHERPDLIIHHTERLLAFSEAAAVHECRMQTCRDACAMPGADPRVEMQEYEGAMQQRVEAMHGAVDAIGRLAALLPDNAPMPRSVGCEASSFDLHNEAKILAAYVEQMTGGMSFDAALDAALAGEDSDATDGKKGIGIDLSRYVQMTLREASEKTGIPKSTLLERAEKDAKAFGVPVRHVEDRRTFWFRAWLASFPDYTP